MTAKEYLSRAYYLDKIINGKLEQQRRLSCLITKVTPTLVPDKVFGGINKSRMEECICNWMDLENEIIDSVNNLMDVSREINRYISTIDVLSYKLLLELRYLNFKSWEEIAVIMDYSYRNIHYIHRDALSYTDKRLHTFSHESVV